MVDNNGELARIRAEINQLGQKFAAMEGTLVTEVRHQGHDLKNFRQAFEALVTRREWDERKQVADERFKSAEERLKKTEDTLTWAMRLVTAAAAGMMFTLYGLGKKVGVL